MMVRRKLLLSTLLILVGCAQQKPQMPDGLYEDFAKVQVSTDGCLQANFITPEEAGQSKYNIDFFLGRFTYDPVRYSALLADGYESIKKGTITQEGCNLVRATIYQMTMVEQNLQRQDEIRMQQQAVATQRSLQALENMQYNSPKTTYCNRFGTQTICSTY